MIAFKGKLFFQNSYTGTNRMAKEYKSIVKCQFENLHVQIIWNVKKYIWNVIVLLLIPSSKNDFQISRENLVRIQPIKAGLNWT